MELPLVGNTRPTIQVDCEPILSPVHVVEFGYAHLYFLNISYFHLMLNIFIPSIWSHCEKDKNSKVSKTVGYQTFHQG